MTVVRDLAVSVFVVRDGCILLHQHKRLARWLPPGGHIDANELPDAAVVREVREETNVEITLVGDHLVTIDRPGQPRQLVRPMGVQLVDISAGHQHIDLVYFAIGQTEGDGRGTWFTPQQVADLPLTEEVRAWCDLAFSRLSIEPVADGKIGDPCSM